LSRRIVRRRRVLTRHLALTTALAVAACSGARDAFAYRPFDGTDAAVMDWGDFEAEVGPVHLYSLGTAGYLIAPSTVLNLGFAPGWELIADFHNLVGPSAPSGMVRDQLVDTDVFAKVLVVPGSLQGAGPWPGLALELGPLLPNAGGEGGLGASVNAIVSQRWPGVSVHVDSWVELTRGQLELDWFEGIILEGDLDARIRPVSEWYVERELAEGATTFSGLVGGIWRARDGLDLDMALREASIAGQRATEVRLGFTWAFGVWSPRAQAHAAH
jgi:hypothetical protein